MEKILNLMHLARKAGKITFGSAACERSFLERKARLLILSNDLSARSAANITQYALDARVKVCRFGNKKLFGNSFQIKDTGIITIDNSNFARGIDKLLKKLEE